MNWKVRLYRVRKGLLAFVEGRGAYTMIMHDYLHYSSATPLSDSTSDSRIFTITKSYQTQHCERPSKQPRFIKLVSYSSKSYHFTLRHDRSCLLYHHKPSIWSKYAFGAYGRVRLLRVSDLPTFHDFAGAMTYSSSSDTRSPERQAGSSDAKQRQQQSPAM